ncbi:hypothetical protein ACQPYK_42125 [Streptosporangium sp. CA-135522]|uniref:hypothetical protein n=1 Tax=Streptosporangium sp. CA-135522 TaxID=3240072 RepID=UPI003D911AE1
MKPKITDVSRPAGRIPAAPRGRTRLPRLVAAPLAVGLTVSMAAMATSATAFAASAGQAASAAAGSFTVAASTAPPAPGAQLKLPRPTGPHAVGRDTLHLVDKHRPDPWVPEAGARQLMVSMYYPARSETGGPAPT